MSRLTNRQNLSLLLALFFLSSALTLIFLSYKKTVPPAQQKNFTQLISLPSASPRPTPTPIPKIGETSQPSADGSMLLTLKTEEVSPQQLRSELFVTTTKSLQEKLIFTETTTEKETFEIPFNTWSPDNRYFFVKKNNQTTVNFLVFEATGKTFGIEPNTQVSLDINRYFLEKEIPYNLDEITGWAAPNLLIVRTKEVGSNDQGPAYWFDVAWLNFIRLSTQF